MVLDRAQHLLGKQRVFVSACFVFILVVTAAASFLSNVCVTVVFVAGDAEGVAGLAEAIAIIGVIDVGEHSGAAVVVAVGGALARAIDIGLP